MSESLYCKECGNEDPKQLAYRDRFADSDLWECLVCGHQFQRAPEPYVVFDVIEEPYGTIMLRREDE